jgi:hypothetical protein
MASRIGVPISFVLSSIVMFGCVGQNKQTLSILTAPSVALETRYHRCLGSACGDPTLFSQWTLRKDSMRPFRITTREGLSCLGTVCGPDAMSPMWILVQPQNTCLSTVCGSNLANSSIDPVRNRLAWTCQSELDKR